MSEALIKRLERLEELISNLREQLDSHVNYYPQEHENRILLSELLREQEEIKERLGVQQFIQPMDGFLPMDGELSFFKP